MRWRNSPGTRRVLLLGAVGTALLGARLAGHMRSGRQVVPGRVPASSVPAPPPTGQVLAAEFVWDVAAKLPRDLFAPAPTPRPARRPGARSQPPTPDPAGGATAPTPRVQILLLDSRHPLAVVDGRRVAVGDSVSGCRVLTIDEQGVTFERRGERLMARP